MSSRSRSQSSLVNVFLGECLATPLQPKCDSPDPGFLPALAYAFSLKVSVQLVLHCCARQGYAARALGNANSMWDHG